MRFNSITFKILFFIIIAFVVATFSVLLLANIHLTKIIDISQESVYSEKLDAIFGVLKDADERLKKTGLVEAYFEDFKASTINSLKKTYYGVSNPIIYPFIIDLNGAIVMHPALKAGDLSIKNLEVTKNMLASKSGNFTYLYLGQEKWCIFRHFNNWDWVIGYAFPLDVKYKDTRKFTVMLFVIMVGITAFVVLVLSLIVTKFTKPIVRLTKISKKISEGDIDQEIDFKNKDEVGTLARSFDNMRNAIKRQILELNEDIKEQKRLKEVLLIAKEKAEHVNEAKSEFLMNVSHDIRTPMNVINGFNDLLMKSPLNEEQKTFCEMIKRKGKDLIKLIEDMIDISAVEQGKVRLHQSPVSFSALIEDICQTVDIMIGEKEIDFKCCVGKDVTKMLLGDSMRLKQVLENLCVNAVKYTKSGEIRCSISIGDESLDDKFYNIRFEVEDTGIGIAEENIPHIFDPYTRFYALDEKEHKEGVGLGLHIVKTLVNEMGGKISVESKLGKGSKFSFVLKMKDPGSLETEFKPDVLDKSYEEVNLEGMNILVAEDDEATRVLMERSFKGSGCNITFASDGEDVLGLMKKNEYDLVLMDLRMPKIDGIETTKEIRQFIDKEVPIFALTAHVIDFVEGKCKEVGMNGYVAKPVDVDNLKMAIQQFVKSK